MLRRDFHLSGRTVRRPCRWFVPALFLALVTGCASTNVAPFTNETTRESFDRKEQTLWNSAEKLERCIEANLEPIEGQEAVERYLDEVMERIASDFDNSEIGVRIHLLPDPSPNAFVLPNGAMYVNTGLLALLENEAQLATVLGHEFCHFQNRHGYRETIKDQNTRIKAAILRGTLGTVLADGEMTDSMAELWTISSVSGYSRTLESEADRDSLIRVIKANYEPAQAIKAFERLQSVEEPEDGDGNQKFATHPKLSDRIADYRKALKNPELQQYTFGADIAAERYNETLYDMFTFNAQLNLDESNYDLCRDNVARCLKQNPDCPKAHYLQGELFRCGPGGDDAWEKALASYERAITTDPNYADPHREAGLLYRNLGNTEEAERFLVRYLSLIEESADIDIIKHYLAHLDEVKDSSGELYRAPVANSDTYRGKVKVLGLMPIHVPADISEAETRQKELEAALTAKLKAAGFEVVASEAYSEIYDTLKEAIGGLYDADTGEPLEEKHEALADHARREYLASHHIDAMAYGGVMVVSANWNTGMATWHGVRESSTGKSGFAGALAAPSAYGTMPALSFAVLIASLYDEPCYVGYGGIQLCSRVSGSSFVDVPVYELLADTEKNARSVDIACKALVNGKK